ncbi:MAG: hypothetical protein COV34_01015 [Candidatus Zambryskibacteria bacterium CG10_big_fil_rev_8_21_14_0_10_42_12]|uniref:Methyltransferase FkbM domain-containing protein n=1 Tax=Candidatus Zambryskibacteria bacterium CG10_big_fil_rev_8_21_14_0_10_42_12 TaxID=1975115 RepID=A0A2H0QV77_9BACT|nr:MAG: hypothetical protein COV34_01015 [Candidatus Zambryskibacteria bacterium CG10_big_fil_rev_8_21_14_0_10_42_12]
MNKKLIFDLGFHNGDDTDFYLHKGFSVVAIEANPTLVHNGNDRFKTYIQKNQLTLLNKAVHTGNKPIKFYINQNRSDWSSCNKRLAEIDGSKAKIVTVHPVSLSKLCSDYGTPFYVKVDVEGCDTMVAEELFSLKEKPKFVSFETSKQTYHALFSWLYVAGYKKFQLVNQLNHPRREGVYKFTEHSSGFFGNDLPKDKWLTFDDALTQYIHYKELKKKDNRELALGWLDVHASL